MLHTLDGEARVLEDDADDYDCELHPSHRMPEDCFSSKALQKRENEEEQHDEAEFPEDGEQQDREAQDEGRKKVVEVEQLGHVVDFEVIMNLLVLFQVEFIFGEDADKQH